MANALEKNAGDGIESKGVKAHFNLDESGIFSLNIVESVFEKNSTEAAEEAEDTLSKLGSAFTKLFSGKEINQLLQQMLPSPRRMNPGITVYVFLRHT